MSCELVFCGGAIQDPDLLLTFRLSGVSISELAAKSRRSRECLSRFRLEISNFHTFTLPILEYAGLTYWLDLLIMLCNLSIIVQKTLELKPNG